MAEAGGSSEHGEGLTWDEVLRPLGLEGKM